LYHVFRFLAGKGDFARLSVGQQMKNTVTKSKKNYGRPLQGAAEAAV
jgi:hypothetical protein